MARLKVDFGVTNTGIGTVGYVFIDDLAVDIGVRTTTGVTEAQFGWYYVDVDRPSNAEMIEWDTGGGSPIFAYEYVVLSADCITDPEFPNWSDQYISAFQELQPSSALQKYLIDLHNTMSDAIREIERLSNCAKS